MRGKIGVYGRSLGGIATTHLCKYVDMVFVDRTFGNLHDVADTKFFGKIAISLFKFATGGWRASSDHDLLETRRDPKYGYQKDHCYKVITCDKNDEIIDVNSSLMVCAAKQFCIKQGDVKLLKDSDINLLIKSVKSILNAEEVLYKFLSLRVNREMERDTISSPRGQSNSLSSAIEYS